MTTPHSYVSLLCEKHDETHKGRVLMAAIAARDTQMLRDAINNGSNPNAGEGLALISAVISGHFPLVQELANQGASFTFAHKLAKDEIGKWDTVFQKAPGKSIEEAEAIAARAAWGDIVSKIDTYQTAYTETQARVEAQQQNQKLDDIVQAINALRETIAEITVPRTIQKPLTIPVAPAPKV